jgi:hypothetical protein
MESRSIQRQQGPSKTDLHTVYRYSCPDRDLVCRRLEVWDSVPRGSLHARSLHDKRTVDCGVGRASCALPRNQRVVRFQRSCSLALVRVVCLVCFPLSGRIPINPVSVLGSAGYWPALTALCASTSVTSVLNFPLVVFGCPISYLPETAARPCSVGATRDAKSRTLRCISSRTRRNASRRCSGDPSAAAGSVRLQWSRLRVNGHTGLRSFASSDNVTTHVKCS